MKKKITKEITFVGRFGAPQRQRDDRVGDGGGGAGGAATGRRRSCGGGGGGGGGGCCAVFRSQIFQGKLTGRRWRNFVNSAPEPHPNSKKKKNHSPNLPPPKKKEQKKMVKIK